MATVMNVEKDVEKDLVDFEVLPEYVRESKGRVRETLEVVAARVQPDRYQQIESEAAFSQIEPERARSSKGEMLETLWPGVHNELAHGIKHTPSLYLTIGFMAGAFISLIGVWLFSMISPMVAEVQKSTATVVTKNPKGGAVATSGPRGSAGVMVPLVSTYEVQSGDSLAAIAYRNYKHCSPRLLDEICQANKLTSANVLNLGQKLILPEYHPSQAAAKIATTTPPSIQ